MNSRGRTMLVLGIGAATLLQLAGAGVVHWWRWQEEQQGKASQAALQDLAARLVRVTTADSAPAGETRQTVQLETEADVPATLQAVQALGDGNGVALQSVKAGHSGTAGKQVFQITGTGSAEQLCGFLADLEQRTPLVLVETGRLQARASGQIVVELGLATYHTGGGR
jgi:hypothetical protein